MPRNKNTNFGNDLLQKPVYRYLEKMTMHAAARSEVDSDTVGTVSPSRELKVFFDNRARLIILDR